MIYDMGLRLSFQLKRVSRNLLGLDLVDSLNLLLLKIVLMLCWFSELPLILSPVLLYICCVYFQETVSAVPHIISS